MGFPGGAVVKNLPADAGDTGSCTGPGGSHMPRSGQAHEPGPLSLRVRSLCSATGEATTVRGPRTAKKKKNKKTRKTKKASSLYYSIISIIIKLCNHFLSICLTTR